MFYQRIIKRKKISQKYLVFFVGSLFLIGVIFLFLYKNSLYQQRIQKEVQSYPEVLEVNGKSMNFSQLSDYFTELSKKKGARYAFEVLKVVQVPPNTDMHLLGHVVGDMLYKQEGAKGMEICTQDFRNACSHSVVVGLLNDNGLDKALPEVFDACKKAPGGLGAYTMCFHGFGHGVLAYTNYEYQSAVKLCKKTGTPEKQYREYTECVGGTLMEAISGGGHDMQAWQKQQANTFSDNDPLYPCSAPFIEEMNKVMCYTYLTPHLFNQAAGYAVGNPTDKQLTKAFSFCNKLDPKKEAALRSACFGGFGKEFVALAQDRDIRRIDQMNEVQLLKVFNWCTLSNDSDAIKSCNDNAVASLFWGGENDRAAAIKFCNIVSPDDYKTACFDTLTGSVFYYKKDDNYRKSYCLETPPSYQPKCLERLRQEDTYER